MHRRQLPTLAALAAPYAALFATPLATPARAAEWVPARPVRIVVSFPPGGSSDSVARLLVEAFNSSIAGGRFVVDNRPGAGGTLAAQHVAAAPPDGTMLLIANTAPITTSPPLYPQAGYDPVRSLTHIAHVGAVPAVAVVNTRLVPATDLAGLAAWVRAQPAPPAFGSSGNGSVGHLMGEMFQRQAGVTLTHAPYRGTSPLLPDLLGGAVPIAFDTLTSYVEHFPSGRLRGLAVSAAERAPAAPGVPSAPEAGFPRLLVDNWIGLSGPAGLPAAVVERLHAATLAALANPVARARLAEQSVALRPLGPAEFTAFVERDVREFGGMVRTLGITAG